jgi:hypothetical protein
MREAIAKPNAMAFQEILIELDSSLVREPKNAL